MHLMNKKFLPRCAALALIVFVSTPVTQAAVFNIANGDVAALKSAIITANGNGQPDIINLASSGAYLLTSIDNSVNGATGLPVITGDLAVNGNGSILQRSTATGIPEFRVLQVTNGATLSCNDITISAGKASGSFPANAGAGIFVNQAMLSLTNSTVGGHDAGMGGGIYNNAGTVNLNGSIVISNRADYGGGIFNDRGVVTGSSSKLLQNSARGDGSANAPGFGAGIYSRGASNGAASVSMTGCTFVESRIVGLGEGSGSGIYNDGSNGSALANFTDCIFDTNYTDHSVGGAIGNNHGRITLTGGTLMRNYGRQGGAIYNYQGSVEASGSMFEGNKAYKDPTTGTDGLGGGIANVEGTLKLVGTTLRLNHSDFSGAAVYSSGTVTITNADLTENVSVTEGGAITNDGELTIADSRLNINTANTGGAIFTANNALVQRCTINGNTAPGGGGGIFNAASLTVESSTLDSNKTPGVNGNGGAIGTLTFAGPVSTTIRNSTLSLNSARRGGGFSNVGTLTIVNSTLSGNTANAEGGGLYNSGGTSSVQADTFYGNSALTGGGIYSANSPSGHALILLSNSVFNTGSNGANLAFGSGIITSLGYNLSNDAAGGGAGTGPDGLLSGPNDIRSSGTNLGPLQDNGGPTKTHLPLFPSPLIDSGDDEIANPPLSLTSDQRGPGFARRIGPRADRGAVEAGMSIIVTTLDDHDDNACTASDCTLREAISAANGVGTGSISFLGGLAGTIQLGAALPELKSNLLLEGPGSNFLTVRRNSGGDYRIFTISNGTVDGPSVTIKGLTITNGRAPEAASPNDSGGGILNFYGRLHVENCSVIGNSGALPGSSYGGGIFNYEGNLNVTACTVAGNLSNSGGGLASSITSGLPHYVSLRSSTVSGNTAAGGSGGGFFSEASGSASRMTAFVSNCTFSGNSATSGGLFGGNGGAIYNAGSVFGNAGLTLEDCTLSGNSAPGASGIYNNNFSATAAVTLRNTILQRGITGSNLINSSGAINSLGHNLCNDAAGGLSGTGPGGYLNATGDVRETDPSLGPLQANGGRTLTHALLNGSLAIDAGEDTAESSVDQRAFARLGTNDIGAFEFGGISPSVPVVSVVSRKLHGATPFDINLPLTGVVGVECRTSGGSNDYQVVVTFASPVAVNGTPKAAVNVGTATIGTGGVANGGMVSVSGSVVTVPLTNVTNAQRITVKLTSVTDGINIGDVVIPMGILIGDTTGNGSVNASDVSQTKLQSGKAVTSSNFRNDITLNGSINATDISSVKLKSGTALP
jgi:CSLREA domain-containing protein